MDRRRLPYGSSLFGLRHWWDENFIHWFGFNRQGIKREILFDWFNSMEYHDSGIYELAAFYARYPVTEKLYQSSPVGTRCNTPPENWVPDRDKLDNLFTSDGRM